MKYSKYGKRPVVVATIAAKKQSKVEKSPTKRKSSSKSKTKK